MCAYHAILSTKMNILKSVEIGGPSWELKRWKWDYPSMVEIENFELVMISLIRETIESTRRRHAQMPELISKL